MATLHLHFDKPDGETDTYHLTPGRRYHIGRGSQCEIRILDMKMSRQHCAIEHLHGVWLIIDLASTNGVSVDGIPVVGRMPLKRGQIIEVGNTKLDIDRVDTESHRRATTFDEDGDPADSSLDLSWDSDVHPVPDTGALTRMSASQLMRAQTDADSADDLTPVAGNSLNESGVLPMQTHMPLTDALEIRRVDDEQLADPIPPDDDNAEVFLELLGKRVGAAHASTSQHPQSPRAQR